MSAAVEMALWFSQTPQSVGAHVIPHHGTPTDSGDLGINPSGMPSSSAPRGPITIKMHGDTPTEGAVLPSEGTTSAETVVMSTPLLYIAAGVAAVILLDQVL